MSENMDTRYDAPLPAGMLDTQHPTMSDVVLYATERALAETSLTHDELAGMVLRAYEDQVDEAVRSIEVAAPRTTQDHTTYSKRDRAAQTRLRRYRQGDQPVPADLVLPWITCLPRHYADWARRTIAHQLGFLGAEQPDAPEAGTDGDLLTDISNGSSEAMRWVVKALADGILNEADAPMAPHIYAALGELVAKAVAAQARVCARTGYQPPETPRRERTGLSVVRTAESG